MKPLYLRTFRFIVGWVLVFFTLRLCFFIFNASKFNDIEGVEFILSILYGLQMDISTIGPMLLLPTILQLFPRFKSSYKINNIYNQILLLCASLIAIIDAGLASNWGTRISGQAISYLKEFRLIRESIISVNYLLAILLMFILFFLLKKVYNYFLKQEQNPTILPISKTGYLLFLIPSLAIIGLFTQGSVGTYRISKSQVFFSQKSMINQATLNPVWSFIDVCYQVYISSSEEYRFFNVKHKEELIEKLFQSAEKKAGSKLFSIDKPNFIFILWESSSGENFIQFGGEQSHHVDILDTLLENSLSFNSFYSTATRTEQGIVAILSSFPGQPKTYLQSSQNKAIWLPNLSKELNNLGYTSSFYHTGSLEYQNTDNFLRMGGFKKIISNKSYDKKWKFANDHELFQKMALEIDEIKEPFFNMCLTSTSHEPFNSEVPKIYGNDKYRNCIHYTGGEIVKFINSLKEKKCFSKTVFIVMSDHAHSLPMDRKMNEPMRFKIPFFIYGEPLKKEFRGQKCSTTGSQIDFNATILNQLNAGDGYKKTFPWSKDILSQMTKKWAFYTYNNGFGLLKEDHFIVYDHDAKKVVMNSNTDPKNLKTMESEGKAFLQEITEVFDKLN